jgi:serine/threonine-protein phosphatase PGAM5
MFSKLVKQAASLSAYSLGGVSLIYYIKNEKIKTAYGSWTSNEPQTRWDDNWDWRAAGSIVKPLKDGASVEKENEYNEKLEKVRSKAARHIILIRHGQYEIEQLEDKDRVLTRLGREQAKKTGDRLKELQFPITNMVVSTMTRAQETASIILSQLGQEADKISVQNCSMIEEGAVCKPSK